MVRKEHDQELASEPHSEALERSDEVAEGASPQGDGTPRVEEVEEKAEQAPDQSAGQTSQEAAEDMMREVAALRDRHLRLAAEFDNYRKRTARENAQVAVRAQAELVKELMDGLDDLMRFSELKPDGVDSSTLIEGVILVERKIFKALGKMGLEVVNPVNEPFNPDSHEAVMTEPALSPEDDSIVSRVFQVGYRFGGLLLRPARVVVKQWNG
jgi:molecular chaperone GrpE